MGGHQTGAYRNHIIINCPGRLTGDVLRCGRMNISADRGELSCSSGTRRQESEPRRLNLKVHQLLIVSTTRQAQHRSYRHQCAQGEPDITPLHNPPLLEASFGLPARQTREKGNLVEASAKSKKRTSPTLSAELRESLPGHGTGERARALVSPH